MAAKKTKKAAPAKKKAAPAKKKAAPAKKKAAPIDDVILRERTGKVWSEWLALLDKAGAREQSHAAIARLLQEQHGVPGWWAQSVTVRYEQERGLRAVGESTRGWQTQAQRTLACSPAKVWAALTRPASRARWLGAPVGKMELREGARFRLADGSEGEVRAVRPERLLRLHFEHGQRRKSTFEASVAGGAEKAVLRLMETGLPTGALKEERSARWRRALDELASLCLS